MIVLADLSPWLVLVAPAVIVAGCTIFGISGFLTQQQMRRVVGSLMVFIGASLVVRAIAAWS